MFYNCYSLSKLPDISKWNISSKVQIDELFFGCTSLAFIPNIGKWDIFKGKNDNFFRDNNIFGNCISLAKITHDSIDYRNCINCLNNQKK